MYAATDRDLVVLQANSVTGYHNATIPVLRVVDYRSGLTDGGLKTAPLSGMAVGPRRVYLTLADRPQIISVAKPRL